MRCPLAVKFCHTTGSRRASSVALTPRRDGEYAFLPSIPLRISLVAVALTEVSNTTRLLCWSGNGATVKIVAQTCEEVGCVKQNEESFQLLSIGYHPTGRQCLRIVIPKNKQAVYSMEERLQYLRSLPSFLTLVIMCWPALRVVDAAVISAQGV